MTIKNPRTERGIYQTVQKYSTVLIFMLFATIVIGNLMAAFRLAERNFHEKFKKDAQIRINLLSSKLDGIKTELAALVSYFEGSARVTSEEFDLFSQSFLGNQFNAEEYFFWAPRDAGGSFHVTYSYGRSRIRKKETGFNLSSDSAIADAIRKAIVAGDIIADIFNPIHGFTTQKMIGIVAPVYSKSDRSNVAGVMVIFYSMREMIEQSIAPTPVIGFYGDYMVWDSLSGIRRVFYSRIPRLGGRNEENRTWLSWLYPRDIYYENHFVFGRKLWAVAISPGIIYFKNNYPLIFIRNLPFSLAFLTLLFFFLRLQARQKESVTRLARIREEELSVKTRELNNFFNIAIDLLCVADVKGYFRRLNPEWERCLGYRLVELEGKFFFDFIHPDDIGPTRQIVRDLSDGKPVVNFVNRYRHSDGSYRWIEWRSSADEQGNIYAAARDITERIRGEDELRHHEAKFLEQFNRARSYLEISETIIVEIDRTGAIERINKKGLELLGYTGDEIMGKNWFSTVLADKEKEPVLDVFYKIMAGEVSFYEHHENMIQSKDGTLHNIYWHNTLKRDGLGAIIGTLSSGLDITNLKSTQKEREQLIRELQEKNSELERFVYTVSHDLKNPLITIQGFSGVLRKTIKKQEIQESLQAVEYISIAAKTMNLLVKDLIDLSRLGKINFEPESVRLYDIICDAIVVVKGAMEKSGAELTIAKEIIECTAPGCAITCDKTRMIEVFQNLISNAIKFSCPGSKPEIFIGIKHDPDEVPVYCIRDNGIGIQQKYSGKIFKLFERLNVTVEGSGVGLAIVKRVVELHGGRIWFESDGTNRGTTFFFTLGHQETVSKQINT